MLRDRYPDAAFEVVNTAVTAINSHAILPIARECAGYQPDLFLVYVGNNEVVGPFGAANVIGRFSPSLSLIRANLAVARHANGPASEQRRPATRGAARHPAVLGGMEMFLKSQVRSGDANLRATYAHFRQNLDDICRAGTGGRLRSWCVPCP